MKIKIDDKNYWIVWIYSGTEEGKQRECICNIEEEGYKVISTGVALCNLQDRFNKETARKISLNRALLKLYPDEKTLLNKIGTSIVDYDSVLEIKSRSEHNKLMRNKFWNAYFNR